MKKLLLLLPLLALSISESAESVTQYKNANYSNTGVTVNMADATGTVYAAGETVRFSARTDADAYILVFDIDTDGFVHLLYPRDSESLRNFSQGEPLEIPSQPSESLVVTGKTGMEFVFAVAVGDRDAISEREIEWFRHDEKQPADRRWRVDGDPLLAANRVAARLVRGMAYAQDVSLAYTYFFVNEAVDYPRYLCEDCYEKDQNPYEPDRPWVATDALDRASGLRYPLAPAFEIGYEAPASTTHEIGGSAPAVTSDGVTNVYVSYYPTWGTDYHPGWSYRNDYGWPGYGYGYYPYYYGSGWYFSIGFNWGRGSVGWGWGYPGWGLGYYGCGWGGYCGSYYTYPCYYGGYGGYYYSLAQRTLRPAPSSTTGRYKYRSDVRSGSAVAYRSKTTAGKSQRGTTAYRGKSNASYTPRSSYKGNSSKGYSSYRSYTRSTRSTYAPRKTTYGRNTYKGGYSDTKSRNYRPRSGDSYTRGKSYSTRTRTFTNNLGRSFKTPSYGTNKGASPRLRSFGSYGGSSHGITKSRGSVSRGFSGGSTRSRSYGGGGKSKGR